MRGRETSVKRRGPLLAASMVLLAAGCSGTNLGNIDETPSDREEMAGPGIFADESGETALKWSTSDKQANAKADTTPTATVAASNAASLDEKTEFELFKRWQRLRSEGADSAEYQEFLQWLKFQEFKAAQ